MDKHPWAREIKAYVDGYEVEAKALDAKDWKGVGCLDAFNIAGYEFRIKPKIITAYTKAWIKNIGSINCFKTNIDELEFIKYKNHNLKLSFEGGTNKLINAEVI